MKEVELLCLLQGHSGAGLGPSVSALCEQTSSRSQPAHKALIISRSEMEDSNCSQYCLSIVSTKFVGYSFFSSD